MKTRMGRVTNIYPDEARVKVEFEDEKNTSMPLPYITFNREYTMPQVGDRVVTMHLENGTSKGFVLGTYFSGGGWDPKTNEGYRKDFDDFETGYVTHKDGKYELHADEKISFFVGGNEILTIEADKVTVNVDVLVNGNHNVTKTGTADVDYIGGGVSLKNHVHTCHGEETSTGH